MIKKIGSILGVLLLLGAGVFLGGSGAQATLNQQKEEAEDNIAEFKKEIKKLEGQTFELLAKLNAVEEAIKGAEARIVQLNGELAAKEAELQSATERFNKKKEEFYSHLRSKYEDGDIDYMEIILDSANLTDVINYNEYYRVVKAQEEAKMAELAAKKEAVVRESISKTDALKMFGDRGETYKCELISELEDGHITTYTQGAFTDLCRGPHLMTTEPIKAIKLLI